MCRPRVQVLLLAQLCGASGGTCAAQRCKRCCSRCCAAQALLLAPTRGFTPVALTTRREASWSRSNLREASNHVCTSHTLSSRASRTRALNGVSARASSSQHMLLRRGCCHYYTPMSVAVVCSAWSDAARSALSTCDEGLRRLLCEINSVIVLSVNGYP